MSNINWEFPTMGGEVMWNTIKKSNTGWKLQINKITGHARILDSNNIRKAWGNPAEMSRLFEKFTKD